MARFSFNKQVEAVACHGAKNCGRKLLPCPGCPPTSLLTEKSSMHRVTTLYIPLPVPCDITATLHEWQGKCWDDHRLKEIKNSCHYASQTFCCVLRSCCWLEELWESAWVMKAQPSSMGKSTSRRHKRHKNMELRNLDELENISHTLQKWSPLTHTIKWVFLHSILTQL